MASSSHPLRLLLFLLLFSFAFSASPRSVSLSLYYETLCPACSSFVVHKLAGIFSDGLISAVELRLVPFGNALLGPNNTVSCQHGSYECLLNAVEACAINVWPDAQVHFGFVFCVESLVTQGQYDQWESCFQKTGLDSKPVVDCYNSGGGMQLELLYAAQTNALNPPREFVPWVLVDGQPLYDDYDNFEAHICRAYGDKSPEACRNLPSPAIQEMEANQIGQVCRAS